MCFQGKKNEFSSNCDREKLECLSPEESSGFDTDTDEMSNTEQDIIYLKDEENEPSKTRSILPYAQPSSSSHKSNLQYSKNIDRSNETFDSNDRNNFIAICRAKNLIAFFRALHEGYFRNIDLNYFVVISDGQLIGIYENEEKACQVAAQTNFNVGNQVGDGMVFPISGNFKSRRKSNNNKNYNFPN